ncbi:MAG: right-handed parallel beta-helix repeat-containing protein, partial [Candidatus Thermoplasmatota archaeon]|nr:right-handed parallel beta-helix repeat-containing protein [Candidatus Thermoplasmatota archaeon]
KYRYFWSTHNITEEGEYTIGCGVRFENGVAIIVSNNNIYENGNGVTLINTLWAMIENNDILENLGTNYTKRTVMVWMYDPKTGEWKWVPVVFKFYSLIGTGITGKDVGALTIMDNNIQNNQEGIYLEGWYHGSDIFNCNITFDKDVFSAYYVDEYPHLQVELWGIVTNGAREETGIAEASCSWLVTTETTVKSTLKEFYESDQSHPYAHYHAYPMQIALAGSLTCMGGSRLTFQNVEYRAGCWVLIEDTGWVVYRSRIQIDANSETYIYSDFNTRGVPVVDMGEGWEYPSGFRADNPNYQFTFRVFSGAIFELKNSHIEYCGYEAYDESGAADITGRGLYLASNDVTIESCIFRNNYYGIIADGILLDVRDCRIEQSASGDFYLRKDARVNTINTTFDKSKVVFGDSPTELSILNVYWYVDISALAIDPSVSKLVDDVEVAVYDKSDYPAFATVTRTKTATRCTIRECKITKNGNTTYTPHTILAVWGEYDGAWHGYIGESKIGTNAITISLENSRPKVTITSPNNNAIVSGTVLLQGTAWDNVRVTNVTFRIGATGEWRPVACYYNWTFKKDTVQPTISWHYPLDTTTLNDGSYTIYVRASDSVDWSKEEEVNITSIMLRQL